MDGNAPGRQTLQKNFSAKPLIICLTSRTCWDTERELCIVSTMTTNTATRKAMAILGWESVSILMTKIGATATFGMLLRPMMSGATVYSNQSEDTGSVASATPGREARAKSAWGLRRVHVSIGTPSCGS